MNIYTLAMVFNYAELFGVIAVAVGAVYLFEKMNKTANEPTHFFYTLMKKTVRHELWLPVMISLLALVALGLVYIELVATAAVAFLYGLVLVGRLWYLYGRQSKIVRI